MLRILHIIEYYFAHHVFFSTGLLLLVGFLFGHFAEKIKLPAITGYILAGILIGDSGLKLIRHENMETLLVISEITLSFIAVIIGGEFSFLKLKMYGKNIFILSISQMFITFFLVSFGLILLGLPNYISFLLGAISAATSPAATAVIVEKLKAKGKFVDYLHGIVALNDAGTVILFSIAFAIFTSNIGDTDLYISHALFHAFKEIFYSIIVGVLGGIAIHFSTIRKHNMKEVNILALGFIFLTTSISISLHLSPLISNMTLGMLLVNMNNKNVRILLSLKPLTPPLYAVFFAIAGTELNLRIFADSSVLYAGFAFISLRAVGKYFGIYFSALSTGLEKNIRKYMGLSLLPHAGVAIGLVLFVQASPVIIAADPVIQESIGKMINIVLMSVFFNEIVGPPLSKLAIIKNLKEENK